MKLAQCQNKFDNFSCRFTNRRTSPELLHNDHYDDRAYHQPGKLSRQYHSPINQDSSKQQCLSPGNDTLNPRTTLKENEYYFLVNSDNAKYKAGQESPNGISTTIDVMVDKKRKCYTGKCFFFQVSSLVPTTRQPQVHQGFSLGASCEWSNTNHIVMVETRLVFSLCQKYSRFRWWSKESFDLETISAPHLPATQLLMNVGVFCVENIWRLMFSHVLWPTYTFMRCWYPRKFCGGRTTQIITALTLKIILKYLNQLNKWETHKTEYVRWI